MTSLTTCTDAEAASIRAAVEIARRLQSARHERGVAHLALSGGSTPARTYELLAKELDNWERIEIWFADERCVGPEDQESNYKLAKDTLLGGAAGLTDTRVHRMEGEGWRESSGPSGGHRVTRSRFASGWRRRRTRRRRLRGARLGRSPRSPGEVMVCLRST